MGQRQIALRDVAPSLQQHPQTLLTPAVHHSYHCLLYRRCVPTGSLKGEHGTGRNVASFVEMEWGTKATELMWELKQLFDPDFVLNPGVILNRYASGLGPNAIHTALALYAEMYAEMLTDW